MLSKNERKEGCAMLSILLLFCGIYVVFGLFGLAFKLTFGVFKFLFLLALSVGSFIFTLVFAVPLLIILPLALVLFVLYCLACWML